MSSVLTNVGAQTALATLSRTNQNLLDTQSRISTGLKVGSAKDNAATWAISTTMKSDVTAFKAISENLSLSASTVSTARGAAEQVVNLVKEIKGKVTGAQNGAVDKAKVQADIDSYLNQIKGVVNSAQFNGVNMIKADGTEKILSSIDRSGSGVQANYVEVSTHDLRIAQGGGLEDLDGLTVLSTGDTALANRTDGEKTINFNFTGPATANGTVNFTYTDAKGEQKSISTSVTNGDANTAIATALAANTAFRDAGFAVTDLGGGSVSISAKNRDVKVAFDGSALSTSAAGTTVASDERTVKMTFNSGKPMKEGETFEFSYNLTGTTQTMKFRVADETSGSILGQDEAGNNIYAINSAVVSDHNVTGTQIADEFETAFLANGDFNAAAGAGTDIGVSNAGATLTITTADNTDELGDFKFSPTDYDSLLTKVESALTSAVDAAADFGSAQKRIDIQKDFVSSLTSALNEGIGSLIDADMNEESARLQALQVQQQLGVQALSMANQAPQQILSLFR